MLNSLCLRLAPLALAVVFCLLLDQAVHLALPRRARLRARHRPAAAWIAMTGSLDPRILWLTAAVTFWTAGFDIIYPARTTSSTAAKGSFSPCPARHRAAH